MAQDYLRNSTVKVAELLQRAIVDLGSMRKGVLTVEFLLVMLLEQEDSIALKIFDELKLDTPEIQRLISDAVSEQTNAIPDLQVETHAASMKVSQEVQILFECADRERKALEDTYISTAAVFLAFFDKRIPSTRKLLETHGLNYENSLEALQKIRGNTTITERDAESRSSALDQFTIDLTAQARRGNLDPVVGREKEIQRLIEILSRRKKNNPIIIGEPGVGKTVVVEGLAQQIVNGDVPEYLLKRRILSLEIGSLMAGAKMQGEFEERVKSIRDEVIASAGDIILFIDEIHTVIGAGRSGGGLDASNMLKPALARGLLQCVGATTLREYKQYIETDKALERRFQIVRVNEPTIAEAIPIVKGLKEKYENYHNIEYTPEALEAAVVLSSRYIQQRFLPDKAIDLIDEAGAAKRMKVIYVPPDIRKLENRRHDLEDEKSLAFNDRNFEKMAHLQMEIVAIEIELAKQRKTQSESASPELGQVTTEDIAQIVSKMTGIPVKKMVEAEAEKLRDLEKVLRARVVGQEQAVTIVSNAIRRNRSGLRKVTAPIASFLFLGPTGVGKTELAKAIAEQILDDENKIIRLDMSEYMERHSISKLIGSPPGYVGYGEGGQLTEAVKHNPYSVILLDEFEKAHPDVYNILLPVLDEGYLTDGEGQRVSFRNCVIIGTSNVGAQRMEKKLVGLTRTAMEKDRDLNTEMMAELKTYLRPEFINRLDDIVIFKRLTPEDFKGIFQIQINDLKARLSQMHLGLEFAEDAADYIIKTADTGTYGARPLKRRLEALVENKIAMLVIGPGRDKADKIKVSLVNNELQVELVPKG